jgi:prophage tail gpP-like protein
MITVKVNGRNFDFWESFDIDLRYDAIASTFTIKGLFTPEDKESRKLFKPLSYNEIDISYNGDLILRGYIINNNLKYSAKPQLATISGYSKTGVLETSKIPRDIYPIQYEGLTLRNIAEKLCSPFGIAVFVDSSATEEISTPFEIEAAKETDTIKSYLASLCKQKNLILTHDKRGNLVITKVQDSTPVQHFTGNKPVIEMDISTNGQKMFSETLVMKQTSLNSNNAGEEVIKNPYVPITLTDTIIQSSGTDNSTELVANNALSNQLKGINLTINCNQLTFDNGDLFKPNNIITVQEDELSLFKRTKFFIESVKLSGNKTNETAVLNCVVPEVYNKQAPSNIFE